MLLDLTQTGPMLQRLFGILVVEAQFLLFWGYPVRRAARGSQRRLATGQMSREIGWAPCRVRNVGVLVALPADRWGLPAFYRRVKL